MSETFTHDNLLAGDYPNIADEGTLISGQNLVRGTLIAKITASGKLTQCDVAAAAGDGSEIPYAILIEDTDASGGDVTHTPYYLSGEFDDQQVTLDAGDTVAGVKDLCRDKSIYLKTVVPQ